jgi:hypothetical protein
MRTPTFHPAKVVVVLGYTQLLLATTCQGNAAASMARRGGGRCLGERRSPDSGPIGVECPSKSPAKARVRFLFTLAKEKFESVGQGEGVWTLCAYQLHADIDLAALFSFYWGAFLLTGARLSNTCTPPGTMYANRPGDNQSLNLSCILMPSTTLL